MRLTKVAFALGGIAITVAGVATLMQRSTMERSAFTWELAWHDEFDRGPGLGPDPGKWIYDIGNGDDNPGWGNHELESYSNSTANVFRDGEGNLVIRATRSDAGGFVSGRIKTQGKYEFTYGRVEARIKIPYAQGIWPAFWMLGDAVREKSWPNSGEIDIMENFGAANDAATTNHGTLHGPGYAGTGITAAYRLPNSERLSDAFHVYAIEWAKNRIEFFVDGNPYSRLTPADLPVHAPWVFNERPFFILLNVAVGGWPAPVGYPDETTSFPQDMLVDYVRVYQRRG